MKETHKVTIYAKSPNGTSNQNGILTVEPKLNLIGLVLSWIANGFKVKKIHHANLVEYITEIEVESTQW